MKNGKNPTVAQRKLIGSMGLRWENWLVVKDEPTQMTIVHRYSDKTTKVIHKEK